MGVELTKNLVLFEVMKVLVVDHDSTSLKIVSKMLQLCGHEVVTANCAIDALTIAREREDDLHLILTELSLPDMGRYELLEKMEQTSKLPIVIMSADDNDIVKLGCLFKGAMLYLVKPLTMKSVRNLWQFPFIKRREKTASIQTVNQVQEESIDENESNENTENQLVRNERKKWQKIKRKYPGELEEEEEEGVESTVLKKPKLIWTEQLHNRFLQAIDVLGIEKAHPKEILQHMNVPGLRKENISSHLQKFRFALKQDQDAVRKRISRSRILEDESIQFSNQPLLTNSSYLSHFGRQLPNKVGVFMAKPPTGQETQPQPSNNNLNSTSPTSNLVGSCDGVRFENLTTRNMDDDSCFPKATPNETQQTNSSQQRPLEDQMGCQSSFKCEREEVTTSPIHLPSLVEDRHDMFKVDTEQLDEMFNIVEDFTMNFCEDSTMNFCDRDFDDLW